MRLAVNILFAILKGNHFVHQSLEYQHFQSEVVNIYEVSPFFVQESWRVSGCVLGPGGGSVQQKAVQDEGLMVGASSQ